jgi:hypothetical protein
MYSSHVIFCFFPSSSFSPHHVWPSRTTLFLLIWLCHVSRCGLLPLRSSGSWSSCRLSSSPVTYPLIASPPPWCRRQQWLLIPSSPPLLPVSQPPVASPPPWCCFPSWLPPILIPTPVVPMSMTTLYASPSPPLSFTHGGSIGWMLDCNLRGIQCNGHRNVYSV